MDKPIKTAKLFTHGRSQAVRLPKEFRLPGTEVRVSRSGRRIILDPVTRDPAEVAALFAAIDLARGGEDLFAVPNDPAVEPDARIFFDP